ncbi:unnamed protein product [Nippostrongylus brasiliensis]|uniref:Transcription elongation factor 1 homolog n=1 Tax=Nippostrongylus brasiliensis TaxID=27835 RepID=A0A0N4XCX1_NIPBR|nr:unnamed protein product [Nippostrongylus brasiliensis]
MKRAQRIKDRSPGLVTCPVCHEQFLDQERCNRAGKFRCKGEDRIKPTKKNVAFCSCYVNVYVHDDGSVLMKGCFGHIGHSVDPALLRLSDYQKDFLKSLLEKGGPLERINPKSPERGIMVDKMTNLKASDADQWNESEREAVEGN